MKWFSFRCILIAGLTLATLSALGFGLLCESLNWQRHELAELMDQRTAIEADIAEMQVTQAAFEEKVARVKISTCGGRLCIAVSTDQGQSRIDWSGGACRGRDAAGGSKAVLMCKLLSDDYGNVGQRYVRKSGK